MKTRTTAASAERSAACGLLTLLCLALPGGLDAQVIGGACANLFVDPVNGSNLNPGTAAAPLQTLSRAVLVAAPNTTVHLLPGSYTAATGEVFPIVMPPGVSLQGTSALNTVIGPPPPNVAGVVLDFNTDNFPGVINPYDNVFVDAVTVLHTATSPAPSITVRIAGGLEASNPTLSNSIVRGAQATNIGIVLTGVLGQVPVGHPDDRNFNGFVEHRPRLVNLTIDGTRVNGPVPARSRDGILNLNNTTPIPNPPLPEGEPLILNVLGFRHLAPPTGGDLVGIDAGDVISSAFETAAALPAPLVPPVSAVAFPPGGPSYPQTFVQANTPAGLANIDYRLRPALAAAPPNPLVGIGTLPLTGATAPNGTALVYPGPCRTTPFDNDGEGFCNPRVAGPAIDVGFDEQDSYIVFGYLPFTTNFGPLPAGTTYTVSSFFTPRSPAATGLLYATGSPMGGGYVPILPPVAPPGVRALGTAVPAAAPPAVGPVCLGGNAFPGFPISLAVPPVGTVTTATLTAGAPFNNTQLNEQFVYFSSPVVLSNLQTFTVP